MINIFNERIIKYIYRYLFDFDLDEYFLDMKMRNGYIDYFKYKR